MYKFTKEFNFNNQNHMSIRYFFFLFLIISNYSFSIQDNDYFMTVLGPKPISEMGIALTHEHILVDFIGAEQTGTHRWKRDSVVNRALPFLENAKSLGLRTFFEASPTYQGRDPVVIKTIAEKSRLNILVSTGYYGADDAKYLPKHAYTESAQELANRWINEFKNGIDGSTIKPGFIKISVHPKSLDDIHKKLTKAAALTHLETGLTITSHTGPSIPAFEQMDIIENNGVSLNAFVWVHAQFERDKEKLIEAAKRDTWISLDGINERNSEQYLSLIKYLKDKGYLHKVLLSQDSGWYTVGQKNGGNYKGYTTIFNTLIPLLKQNKFTDEDINTLLVKNPAKAFSIRKQAK